MYLYIHICNVYSMLKGSDIQNIETEFCVQG